jgi:hypothetical protein
LKFLSAKPSPCVIPPQRGIRSVEEVADIYALKFHLDRGIARSNNPAMETFASVIGAFGRNPVLAAELKISPNKVAVWKHREWIPPEYWAGLVAGAERRGIEGITPKTLIAIASSRTRKRPKRMDRADVR